MEIIEFLSRSRNDFQAKYKCEHCGYEMKASGYSDDNFYDNVIPNVCCLNCGLDSFGNSKNYENKKLSEGSYYNENTLNLTNNVDEYYVLRVYTDEGIRYIGNKNNIVHSINDENIKKYNLKNDDYLYVKKAGVRL